MKRNVLQFIVMIGLSGGKRSFSQRLLLTYEEISLWLLECSRPAVIRFAYISSICATLLYWRNVHYSQAHVWAFSACDVSKIFGGVFDPQEDGTYAYHDQRNGIIHSPFDCSWLAKKKKKSWVLLINELACIFQNFLMLLL